MSMRDKSPVSPASSASLLVALLAIAAPMAARAQVTGPVSVASALFAEVPVPQCNPDDYVDCLNGVSGGAVTPDGLRRSSAMKTERLLERIELEELEAAGLGEWGSGLAAGDSMGVLGGLSFWANLSTNHFSSNFVPDPVNAPGLAMHDSRTNAGLVGVDTFLGERVLVGAAFGYEDSKSETPYNGGEVNTDGFSINPYAALMLSDWLSVDVIGGRAWLDNDQFRVAPLDGSRTTASFDSRRYFVASNVNALTVMGDFLLGLSAGYLYTEQNDDAYTETGSNARSVQKRTLDLSQFSTTGTVGYDFGGADAYGFLTYRRDLSRSDGAEAGGLPSGLAVQPADNDEFEYGVGFNIAAYGAVSGGLQFSQVVGRDQFDSFTVNLTGRVDF